MDARSISSSLFLRLELLRGHNRHLTKFIEYDFALLNLPTKFGSGEINPRHYCIILRNVLEGSSVGSRPD